MLTRAVEVIRQSNLEGAERAAGPLLESAAGSLLERAAGSLIAFGLGARACIGTEAWTHPREEERPRGDSNCLGSPLQPAAAAGGRNARSSAALSTLSRGESSSWVRARMWVRPKVLGDTLQQRGRLT